MATYLLSWNPLKARWSSLARDAEAVRAGQVVISRWGCGRSTLPKEGDRVFLIRLVRKPKGIIASGWVTKGSYEDLHWDAEKAAFGETSRFVQFRFDALINFEIDPLLPRELLNETRFSRMTWDTQMSGVHIPESIAEDLEKVWVSFAQVSR